jgi:hypothetical protein
MSQVWEVPVVRGVARGEWMPRRLLRADPASLPRDARPSRARRERLPLVLRREGAAPRLARSSVE